MILIGSIVKKDNTIICKCFQKSVNIPLQKKKKRNDLDIYSEEEISEKEFFDI